MSTFVPNGNKPIKTEEAEETERATVIEEPIDTSPRLNYFPGWKRSEKDEFRVDL